MEIAFGTDEWTGLARTVVAELCQRGHSVAVMADGKEWPDVGRSVGEAVASGLASLGVVCCTTGTGVSIAANKVPGARAALCTDAATAAGARRWNDANVLALSLRLTSELIAIEILDAFTSTPFDTAEAGCVGRLEPDWTGSAAGRGGLLRESEDPFPHDVAEHLVGAAGHPEPGDTQDETTPGVGTPAPGVGDESGAEDC